MSFGGRWDEPAELDWKSIGRFVGAVALFAALGYLTAGLPSRTSEAIRNLAEAAIVASVLLWSFRQPRGEVGAPPAEEPVRDKHSWWTVLILLGFAAFAWFDPLSRLEPLVGFNLLPAFFATVLAGSGLAMLRRMRIERTDNYEEGAIEARNQAVLCFVGAAAVLAIWGMSWMHLD